MDTRKLENILDKLQIKISNKGYKYWILAVEIYSENKKLNKACLYKEIAKAFNSTPSRVERALRHAYKDKQKYIQEYFDINYNIDNSVLLELLTREMERSL